ncbi:MAG: glutaredoxin [Candidatus Methanoperedens nitroreducens]|uniref:Glutaredoxin n=1 Tax=Candidatus Methanoperedens nitratireducens TaxID=1392998 RepID=A0A0P8A144_9EURY|nr:glutaredoxin family protein [Candidatus Methanoperedens sp. BLZ2]KAB2944803.1 MAG: glutaredoxin family protein [Candidatus Methanoperedens sp.]KPQ41696.1 MAG: glutaredoxin [Candidatus Methanoperedens sp. BLZ1]MBZ0177093.1 glutaredoxin family protein [Candidatus Methanoperedens nitroreducens]MCX9077524.1 glutaredoxin family protein [Candidatus Methanoperedens sp.]
MKKNIKPKLYTLSTCVHCRATKRFLKKNGIEYDYVDVDKLSGKERENIISEMMKISPDVRFPTIIIGDEVIIGFREDKIREALGL